MFNPKVFVAEFIGTFALVFVGAAAGIYGQSVGLLGIALAHGLTLVAFIYAFGHISGAHINPAVTLGLAANGNVKWSEAVVYWVAQLSGASVAAYLLKTLVDLIDPNVFASMATNGLLTTEFPYYAIGLEALLTFFLVNVVLQMAVEGKAGQFAGWAIGITYAVAILAGGPLTGASLNPARSFGPAIFTSAIEAGRPDVQNSMFYLVYFVGPFAGAILAVLLNSFFKYEFVLSDEELDEMDESEEEPVVKPVKKTTRKPAARKSTARKTTKK
ncbi:MAG TPA: aquaporin [Anaerolineales bacterium]